MPIAFQHSGLIMGVFATIFVAIICTHCSYILVKCAHKLYYLAPVSLLANGLMGLGLGITVYYLVQDIPPISERPAVMPLENNMKHPRHFLGLTGVLNQGMAGVTMIYILLGFLGYLNLAQSVKILIALAVFCTYGLQYFVCLELSWDAVKARYKGGNPKLAEYIVRTLLVTSTVVLAVAVPTIGPFIALIGSLCFSILGLICPAVIEVVTFWDDGLGPDK
ncbi:hypothetical protein B566_EDAN016156 [Ephemera danica]|nr:hypothetical protein B566_EDAN016156 [Ephemera danica]